MKIVFLSHASLFNGFVVGSHQIAKAFINSGHKVLHISSPVSLIHLFLGKDRRNKLFYALKNNRKTVTNFGFVDYIPISITPLGYSKLLDIINNFIINIQIKNFANYNEINTSDVDLCLIDQPFFYHSLFLFKNAKKVYRPTDLYVDMGGSRFSLPEAKCLNLVSKVVATSDAVAVSISKQSNKPICVIRNGVDYDLFDVIPCKNRNLSCIYVGAIDFRFDLELMVSLAKKFPNIVFNNYGPISINVTDCKSPNLFFHGSIGYSTIPSVLVENTFSIIPMNHHPANDGRSPMKLYEFSAAGLPVFCPLTASINEPDEMHGIYLYLRDGDIVSEFDKFIKLYSNFDYKLAKSIAYKNSWQQKSVQILNFIYDVQ